MSSLPGHAKITKKAVDLLASGKHPVYAALGTAGVPLNVVARDVLDVVILGHWADFGQCHHFMRRFDGQSEREAYDEAVQWIWKNGSNAARILSRQIARMADPGSDGPTSSQSLGNALHALQDSFAWGHVEREAPLGPYPGEIKRIKRYSGSEKDGHAEADEQWRGTWKSGFSESGWLAVRATQGLLQIIVESAIAARGDRAVSLLRFDRFVQQWLKPSESLSRERDRAFDLIDRFYTGVRLGAMNVKTLSMDEEGLAKALIDEVGTNTALTLRVFERLRDHYSSDSDDVAEIYVNAIRKGSAPLEGALRTNKPLVRVLIQVMDEGWTSSGEHECIDYLKGLG